MNTPGDIQYRAHFLQQELRTRQELRLNDYRLPYGLINYTSVYTSLEKYTRNLSIYKKLNDIYSKNSSTTRRPK